MNADEQRDFTEFVEACAHSLFRTAMGLTGDRQQAEDLLQTVLANAARHWDRIRRADQPAAYVRRALYPPEHQLVAAPVQPAGAPGTGASGDRRSA